MTSMRSFRKAIESRDIAAASRNLAPDVTFFSPVMPRPYHGRGTSQQTLAVLEQVFDELRYTNELVGEALYGDLWATGMLTGHKHLYSRPVLAASNCRASTYSPMTSQGRSAA